jgi:hypothetical protein
MSIDNPHAHSEVAAEIVEQSEQSAQEIILRSGLAGVLSAVPLVGSAINEMLTELAVKRVYERMQAMMEEMGIRAVSSSLRTA